jgi:phospholipase C
LHLILRKQPAFANNVAFDNQIGPIVNGSSGSADFLTAIGMCGNPATTLPGVNAANLHALGRCSYGPRKPFVVISPWAKRKFVDHTVTDQTSPLRFIEDN